MTSVALGNVIELRQGQKPLGGVSLPDFTIDHSTANGRVEFMSTNPAGWNTNIGRMTFDCEFTPKRYFTANPTGHFAIVLRQDPALVNTAVRGQGVAVGNTTDFMYKPSDLNPTILLETWFNGIGAGNFTYPNSEAARSAKLTDGVTYRIIVDSLKANDGNRYLRYRLYTKDLTWGDWVQLVDTGDVLDFNTGADLTQSGFMIGQVFESNLVTWSLVFTNAKITWGPAENPTPDQTSKLSRYGAQLEGDLSFLGTSRTLRAPANAGPSLVTSLAVQSSTTNTATTLVFKPNGSATNSGILCSNNSVSATTYQAVTFGISGATGLIETFGLSAAHPVFGVNIGGTRIATFGPTGMTVLAATKAVGESIGYSVNLINFGGANATTFSTTGNVDVDGTCNIGYISSFIGPTYDAAKMENSIRPVWAMLSYLIKNLQDKKVI